MKEKKKITGPELMGTGRVGSVIIRLALPMMAAMLAQTIYNMTDMFFIGQTKDPNMVAAISLAAPVFALRKLWATFFLPADPAISRECSEQRMATRPRTSAVALYTVFGVGILFDRDPAGARRPRCST